MFSLQPFFSSFFIIHDLIIMLCLVSFGFSSQTLYCLRQSAFWILDSGCRYIYMTIPVVDVSNKTHIGLEWEKPPFSKHSLLPAGI
ncbi:hypothetical protein BDV11DRAFT_20618 [Aspergillus similis]